MPGYAIKHVAGDALCILRSFKEAVKTVSDITVSIEDLQLSLRREILHRFEFYREFSIETCDLLKELDNFLSNPLKFYNSEVVDIFLLALGNAYEVNTVVLQSNVDKCWTTDLSNTKNNFTTNSYFAKSLSPHVHPITPDEDARILSILIFSTFFLTKQARRETVRCKWYLVKLKFNIKIGKHLVFSFMMVSLRDFFKE